MPLSYRGVGLVRSATSAPRAYLGSIALFALALTTHFQHHSEAFSLVLRDCGTSALTIQIGIRDAMSILPPCVRAIVQPLESFACSPSPSLHFTLATWGAAQNYEALLVA